MSNELDPQIDPRDEYAQYYTVEACIKPAIRAALESVPAVVPVAYMSRRGYLMPKDVVPPCQYDRFEAWQQKYYVPLYAAAPQPAEPDMRAICEALGFDPTNHHNAAKCPYCQPAPRRAVQPSAQAGVCVAVLRFERGVEGKENDMPSVVSCDWLPDGDYPVALTASPTEPSHRAEPAPHPGCGCTEWEQKHCRGKSSMYAEHPLCAKTQDDSAERGGSHG